MDKLSSAFFPVCIQTVRGWSVLVLGTIAFSAEISLFFASNTKPHLHQGCGISGSGCVLFVNRNHQRRCGNIWRKFIVLTQDLDCAPKRLQNTTPMLRLDDFICFNLPTRTRLAAVHLPAHVVPCVLSVRAKRRDRTLPPHDGVGVPVLERFTCCWTERKLRFKCERRFFCGPPAPLASVSPVLPELAF